MGSSDVGLPCWMCLTNPIGYRSRSQKLTTLSSSMVTCLPHLVLWGCWQSQGRLQSACRLAGPEVYAVPQLCVTQWLPYHTIKDKTREPTAYVFRKHKCFPASRSHKFLQTITDTPSLLVWTADKLLLAIQTLLPRDILAIFNLHKSCFPEIRLLSYPLFWAGAALPQRKSDIR